MVVVPPIEVLRSAAMTAEGAEHFEEAERLYLRMLSVARRFYSNFPLELAAVMTEVAEYYNSRQSDSDAIALFEEALRLYKDSMGDGCCCAGLVKARLAQIHKKNGDYSKANLLLKEVENIAALDKVENA